MTKQSEASFSKYFNVFLLYISLFFEINRSEYLFPETKKKDKKNGQSIKKGDIQTSIINAPDIALKTKFIDIKKISKMTIFLNKKV